MASQQQDTNVPTVTVTLSTPSQRSLLGEPGTSSSNPPAYTQQEGEKINDNSNLAYPSQAYIPSSSTQTDSTDLPTYDHAKVDMPPIYQSPVVTPEANIDNVPLNIQAPWPITKKLYFLGFLFWPLWFIGMGFSIFGRGDKTRMWGRRCASNSFIIIIIFVYLLVAYMRTRGRPMTESS